MSATIRKAVRCRPTAGYLACLLAVFVVQQLALPRPVLAIRCFKTSIGSTAHDVDCGPLARACRIIVKPYKTQNNSAVTNCADNQVKGRYVFDCAVECPLKKQDRYWNEVECCTSNMCNTGSNMVTKRQCYISKGGNSTQDDYLQACNLPKSCGVNLKTEETKCVDDAQCKSEEWKCCKGDACLSKWGVEKVSLRSFEDESMDAGCLAGSLALGTVCLLAAKIGLVLL